MGQDGLGEELVVKVAKAMFNWMVDPRSSVEWRDGTLRTEKYLQLAKVAIDTLEIDDIEAILTELEKAVKKYPTWPSDPLHALAVLGEEYGELTKAVLQHTYEPHKATAEDVRMEAIQTAAMALRFFRSLDQYHYLQAGQHEQ